MNPTSGSDILSYQGNANLGLNTDGLSYAGDTDTSLINDVVNRAANLNFQKNQYLYLQKKKDRDDTFNLIASGKLNIPQVRPEDRQTMLDKAAAVKQILLDTKGDVKSNIDTYTKFQTAIQDFDEAKKYATSRLIEGDKMLAEIAGTERPDLKAAYQKHYDQQFKKGLYEEITPFQHQLDWTGRDLYFNGKATPAPTSGVASAQYDRQGNIDVKEDNGVSPRLSIGSARKTDGGLMGVLPEVSQFYDVAVSAPDANFYRTTKGLLNYEKMLSFSEANYRRNDGEGSYYRVNKAINDTFSIPDGRRIELRTDAAIDDLNKQRILKGLPLIEHMGIQRDAQGNALTDAQGNILSSSTPAELKAKLNLVGLNPVVATTDLDKEAAQIARIKSQMDADRALAYQRRAAGGLSGAKARLANAKTKETEVRQTVHNYFGDIVARSQEIELPGGGAKLGSILGSGKSTGKTTKQTVILDEDLPEGFMQVVGGVSKDGKKTIPLLPLDLPNGKKGFIVEESKFFVDGNGNKFSDAAISAGYKKAGYKTKEDFIAFMLNNGFMRETELVGQDENGNRKKGTSQSTMQGLLLLNNKSKSGKDDEILYQDDNNEE